MNGNSNNRRHNNSNNNDSSNSIRSTDNGDDDDIEEVLVHLRFNDIDPHFFDGQIIILKGLETGEISCSVRNLDLVGALAPKAEDKLVYQCDSAACLGKIDKTVELTISEIKSSDTMPNE